VCESLAVANASNVAYYKVAAAYYHTCETCSSTDSVPSRLLLLLPLLPSTQHRTVKRYATGISTGVAICFCVFSAMMLFGFKTFGTASQTLLLNNYHRTDDSLATLARLATGCAILCGYPLMFAALKTSGLNAAHEISRKFKSVSQQL
jgi:Transmembrane amino acid transporter protein